MEWGTDANGHPIPFLLQAKNVLKFNCGDGWLTLWKQWKILSCALLCWIIWYMNYVSIELLKSSLLLSLPPTQLWIFMVGVGCLWWKGNGWVEKAYSHPGGRVRRKRTNSKGTFQRWWREECEGSLEDSSRLCCYPLHLSLHTAPGWLGPYLWFQLSPIGWWLPVWFNIGDFKV